MYYLNLIIWFGLDVQSSRYTRESKTLRDGAFRYFIETHPVPMLNKMMAEM